MKYLPNTLVVAMLATILAGCSAESTEVAPQPIRPVKLLEVTDINAASIRVFPAKVAATKQAELGFRVSGQLIDFTLVEGVHVKKGAVLAQLDDRDARNTLLNREADHELATADYKRKGELLRRQLISPADYDLAKAQLKSATAALANARDQLSYTSLIAPYDGTVAKISIDNFQMIQANQSVLILQKDNDIDVVIQVPESMANQAITFNPNAKFQPQVRFSNQAEKSYQVSLKEYATQVTPGTQSYEVVYTLPRPTQINVLPGMSAELMLDLSLGNELSKTVIPASAVMKRDLDGESIVWVYQDETGKVTPKIVTLGRVTTDGIEILTGLSLGDQLVVAGVQYLSDDQQVKPLRWQRGV
ncbi:efflux RND transporter periplasmic adaptor subunit [Shewanella eurypsychrophilus]|uniref:Efflux RND transporter periplasmic adaptor subunit n=1 Tax=Shewanella eurypsychrophilus TaxID=2593656 RepID=A0ABX6VL47_9GAMM|nr:MULTISPECIES: efflux RND transporter periplasmic adaptor subunit [Shewanella]QPG60600.2 efflux RND transporter periplasmic adaptor subunit [Shewanella eurypsychrophilus]